jgi:hypothetical protein
VVPNNNGYEVLRRSHKGDYERAILLDLRSDFRDRYNR